MKKWNISLGSPISKQQISEKENRKKKSKCIFS